MPTCKTPAEISSRYYLIDGVRYPRVTAILDVLPEAPGLVRWRQRTAPAEQRRIAQTTARIGQQAETHIYAQLSGLEPPIVKVKPELTAALEAWAEYCQLYGTPKPISIQQPLWDDTLGYAGTPDFYEPDVVSDLKVTTRLSERHKFQVTAYAPLIQGKTGIIIRRVRLIRLDPSLGMCEVWESPVEPWRIDVFFHLKQIATQLWSHEEREDE